MIKRIPLSLLTGDGRNPWAASENLRYFGHVPPLGVIVSRLMKDVLESLMDACHDYSTTDERAEQSMLTFGSAVMTSSVWNMKSVTGTTTKNLRSPTHSERTSDAPSRTILLQAGKVELAGFLLASKHELMTCAVALRINRRAG